MTDPVPGWFDFDSLYRRAVAEAPPHSLLIEIGVYHGKSLRYLAHAAKASGKPLTVIGVDWGRGSAEHGDHADALPAGNLAGVQLRTLLSAGVADDTILLIAPSHLAASVIGDKRAWMVFLDGDHSEEGVADDIARWRPKVMPGGILAGHDYFTFPGVRNAVHAAFGQRDCISPDTKSCWEVRV